MPPTQPPASSAAPVSPTLQNRVDTDDAARKRQEIGLTPRRATAQQAVARPPDARTWQQMQHWLVTAAVAALAVLALAFALRLLGNSTGAASSSQGTTAADPAALPDQGAFAPVQDDFAGEESVLVRDFQSRRWSMGTVDGVYRIRMWPGVIAWSTLGQGALESFRLATSITVARDTPQGYGGIIARYRDDDHLYLVEIDGGRRFRVRARDGGEWLILQDWTQHPALKEAGQANELVVEDRPGENGGAISIFANGESLATIDPVTLAPGDAGVVAGSLLPAVAEANFDWLQLTPLE